MLKKTALFVERHPIITTILVIVLISLGYGVAGNVMTENKIDTNVYSPVLVPNLILVAALLAYYAKAGFSKFFLQRDQRNHPSAAIYAVPVAVLVLVAVQSFIQSGGFTVPDGSMWLFLFGLIASVALMEELVFRSLMLRSWLHKGTKQALIISSIIFGLVHLTQLMGGQMGLLTAMQIAFAILFGISMAFIVIKTGSVIFPIAYHFLFDFSQVITTSPGATNTSESSLNIYSLAVLVISSLALVGYCVWMAKTQPDVVTE